jgi:2,3-bisphosphoglycerate-independent phosphoglycerate mutase
MSNAKPVNTPMVVIVRDGWGQNPHAEHDQFNAVKLAKKPVDDRLRRDWPSCLVKTSGLDVGVPPDQTGNSEVGHQNIGAGRIVDQEVVRISKACDSGEIAEIPSVRAAIVKAKSAGKTVHLMGIASDAGVHGLLDHLYALMRACKKHGATKVAIHLFTDGRDTPPFSGKGFVEQVEAQIKSIGVGTIASVAGRYWAMDRDFRWERVEKAYRVLTGRGADLPVAPSASAAIEHYYKNPISATQGGDEFVTPTMIGASRQETVGTRITDGDAVIFYNYRGDRPRELAMAFILPEAEWGKVKPSPDSGHAGFERGRKLNTQFVAMTAWAENLVPFMQVAFAKPPKMPMIAGELFSSMGLRQFRCAETEKFPHVTFFFNDYREEPFPGEVRGNPQSPKVATYDMKPEMAASEVRDMVLSRLKAEDCEDVLIVNFANCDMVGHTGNLQAAIKAVEVTDACVGAIVDATLAKGGSLIVTADHGNAEQMWDPEAKCPHTAHTMYDVPLFVVGEKFKGRKLRDGADRGRLADVIPTALEMMGIAKPEAMTGKSLLI